MSRIQGFRGWRYDPASANAGTLQDLLTPPYDVIDTEQQAKYYQRNPHNVIRLILGRDAPGDGDHENRYTRAASLLSQWEQSGILRQEPAPALYLLQEHYQLPGGAGATRTGFIARLRVAPWGQDPPGSVLPHERTFPSAKADRLALTIATKAQFSPIFALYSDPDGFVEGLLAGIPSQPPDSAYGDDEGVKRSLWVITDPALLGDLAAFMQARTVYVADGHHRWETALNYQRLRRDGGLPEASPPPPLSAWDALPAFPRSPIGDSPRLQPFDYVMVYAARMEDPGVTILPTHRCLRDVPDFQPQRLLSTLRAYFDVTPLEHDRALLAALAAAAGVGLRAYGLVLAGNPEVYLLRLQPTAEALALLHAQDHPAVAAIDVAALQSLVLGPLLGVDRDPAVQKRHVVTVPAAAAAIDEVRRGRCQAAFLVNPTTVAQLQAVADAGQVAPPKATYFYPKLPSGLVINRMADPL